jgi:hypothetical protein
MIAAEYTLKGAAKNALGQSWALPENALNPAEHVVPREQKTLSWPRVKAVAEQLREQDKLLQKQQQAAAAVAASRSKKGKKKKANAKDVAAAAKAANAAKVAAARKAAAPPTPVEFALNSMRAVEMLRREEAQANLVLKILGWDEVDPDSAPTTMMIVDDDDTRAAAAPAAAASRCPAVQMSEGDLRDALKRMLDACETPSKRKAALESYVLLSRQVLPLSGRYQSASELFTREAARACRDLMQVPKALGDRLTALVQAGRLDCVWEKGAKKIALYSKRVVGRDATVAPLAEAAACVPLKAMKPWRW